MSAIAYILASGDDIVYVIAVLVLIGGGWIVERIKSAMAGMNQQQPGTPPRPRTRPHPTSLPRPQIPPLAGDEFEQRPRPSVPPAMPRPRPPVRQPGPGQHSEIPPHARPGMQPRPFDKQRPHPGRSIEEKKAVIRGEEAARAPRRQDRWDVPQPRRVAPAPQVPPPQPAAPTSSGGSESWTQLSSLEQARPGEGKLGRIAELLDPAATAGHAAITAQTLRALSPIELRQAFVLKEILEPPLALRDW